MFTGHVKIILQLKTKAEFFTEIPKNLLSYPRKREIFDLLLSCYIFLLGWHKNPNCDLPGWIVKPRIFKGIWLSLLRISFQNREGGILEPDNQKTVTYFGEKL